VPELLAQMNGTFADPNRPHAGRFAMGNRISIIWRPPVRSWIRRAQAWDGSISLNWLACLRELPRRPRAPISRRRCEPELGHETLTTQLASWTQLRRDTTFARQAVLQFRRICFIPLDSSNRASSSGGGCGDGRRRSGFDRRAALFRRLPTTTNLLQTNADWRAGICPAPFSFRWSQFRAISQPPGVGLLTRWGGCRRWRKRNWRRNVLPRTRSCSFVT
jgi:hypothetical protein